MHADISINGMIFQSSNLALITRTYNVYNFTFYRRIWYEEVWTPLISHDSKSTGKETKASPSCRKSLSDWFSLSRSYIQAYDTKLPCSFRCCVWRRSTALVSMISPVCNTMYFSAVRIMRSRSETFKPCSMQPSSPTHLMCSKVITCTGMCSIRTKNMVLLPATETDFSYNYYIK